MGSSAFEANVFFGLIAWLYYGCFFLLAALGLLVAWKGRTGSDQREIGQKESGQRRSKPDQRASLRRTLLRHTFLGLTVCLLLWQLTLFCEVRTTSAAWQLGLGRLNFAVMALAAPLALCFVQQIPLRPSSPQSSPLTPVFFRGFGSWRFWARLETMLLLETVLLALLTQGTPWVDAGERVERGHAISTYGPLFALYGAHVVGYWTSALWVVRREWRHAMPGRVRDQLRLVGSGILVTGTIALVTNLVLPYGWGEFRWGDIGPLSVFGFWCCVAYATFLRRLFALGIFLRETLVHGLLLAFVLGAYSSTVFVISQYLTSSAGQWTQFAVLVIAFSFDPVRRFLEEKADRLLFGKRQEGGAGELQQQPNRRGSNRRTLMLLFPWRHP